MWRKAKPQRNSAFRCNVCFAHYHLVTSPYINKPLKIQDENNCCPLVRLPRILLKHRVGLFFWHNCFRKVLFNPRMVMVYLPFLHSCWLNLSLVNELFKKKILFKITHTLNSRTAVSTHALERHKSGIGCRHRTDRMVCLGSPNLTCRLPTHTPFQTALLWCQSADWATVGRSLWEGREEGTWIKIL